MFAVDHPRMQSSENKAPILILAKYVCKGTLYTLRVRDSRHAKNMSRADTELMEYVMEHTSGLKVTNLIKRERYGDRERERKKKKEKGE